MKHSKYKNTGLIFELLVRQITADSLAGNKSKATDIIKKYYFNTELSKEFKIYNLLLKNQNLLTENKINPLLDLLNEEYKKINKTLLKKEKYNLIKEIKNNYNLDDFFKNQVNNYKTYASLSILLEEKTNPETKLKVRDTLYEYLKHKELITEDIDFFKKEDKDTRILTYKILLNKFNEKYQNLNEDQKRILSNYLNLPDNNPKMIDFYNNEVNNIKTLLKEHISKSNPALKIKLNEVSNILTNIDKTSKIKDKDINNLLKFYLLLEELNEK